MAWQWRFIADITGPPGDAAATARLNAVEAALAALKTSHISLDTDGVPYYDPGSMTVQVLQDDDGTPYFMQALA